MISTGATASRYTERPADVICTSNHSLGGENAEALTASVKLMEGKKYMNIEESERINDSCNLSSALVQLLSDSEAGVPGIYRAKRREAEDSLLKG